MSISESSRVFDTKKEITVKAGRRGRIMPTPAPSQSPIILIVLDRQLEPKSESK